MTANLDIKQALESAGMKGRVRYDEPMGRHTSLGIGGLADIFVSPLSEEELKALLVIAREFGIRVLPLGGGTNLLVRDFQEVRRRTRPMGFFPTDDSAQRIFYGVTNGIHQNGHHPLPTISAEILT